MKDERVAAAKAFNRTIPEFTGDKKEFVEAIKSGRPLAAEAAFKRLSEERRDIAPIRYFQAAEIARQMGRETLRRDRLAHYLRTEKTWNASVEEAAWYLCLNGGAAERLFMKVGRAWLCGRDCLRLPSTSPAYTLSYERKLAQWRQALQL